MLHYLNASFAIVILASIYFCFVVSQINKNSDLCNKNCSDIDFNNCENKVCSNETDKVLICYFSNWAVFRPGIGKCTPENIDTSLCTHIVYAFTNLDSKTYKIKSSNPDVDLKKSFYKSVAELKSKNLSVLISVGGWENSKRNDGWNRMFRNKDLRTTFIKSVLKFLRKYKFDGLVIDLEYPGCPQGNSLDGLPSDANDYNTLLREMKAASNGTYHVAVTVSAGEENLKKCYNVTDLCNIADWIHVMAYDYNVPTDRVVGANSPMCGTNKEWGVRETLCYLTEVAKCPAKQLVLGMPLYGHSFTLEKGSAGEFGLKSLGPGKKGLYTRVNGTLSYYEICLNEKNGWKTGWSSTNNSFINQGDQFVSFDGVTDFERKCCFVNKLFGLRGAMVWELCNDDFSGACGCGKFLQLRTLNQKLRCLNDSEKCT